MAKEKPADFPGRLYMRIITGAGNSGAPRRCRAGIVGWILVTIFATAFFFDFIDLMYQGPKHDPVYGKTNMILVVIGFASSEVLLFRAVVTSLFAVLKGHDIVRCVRHTITASSAFAVSTDRHSKHARFGRFTYAVVETLSVLRLACALSENWNIFWKESNYSFFTTPAGPTSAYLFSMVVFCSSVNFPLIVIFYYLCSLLCDCAEVFAAELQGFLDSPGRLGNAGPYFTQELRYFGRRFGVLSDAFDEAERVFSIKYLIDLVGTVLEVVVVMSFVATWATVPSLGNPFKGARMCITFSGAVIRLTVLTIKPLELSNKAAAFRDLLDSIVANRQRSRTRDEGDLSVEELEITQTLGRKLRSRTLTFSAGGIIQIDRSAIVTMVFLFLGFFCFIVERIENTTVAALEEFGERNGNTSWKAVLN